MQKSNSKTPDQNFSVFKQFLSIGGLGVTIADLEARGPVFKS